ncbi:diacylglycerol kinase catalytic region [Ferrimonas balearica DSM 9799]|uniref:Probable lipid kinase YegS-like n=1 Tax=Ferrimonas balearica (strain DSM 9799 / CCM 4581 / KCTC 23876 / PAT) TaxID=550540 RepID=E1SSD0_FERBD|nr:lipid kinase YegS [Ferrimonas balearica]ADN74970.1 diacylglycerol kinase catalytic region [Ferrimonas balearica DSM 9799]
MRLILNGKKAGLPEVRAAIIQARQSGPVEVRVTWEGGDVERLVREAVADGCSRLVAAGGDGTVNEVVNALMALPAGQRPELAILPLGTANDFARGCGLPESLSGALFLAQQGEAVPVDCGRANEHHFINMATGGFGARITATTPEALKNFLGGGAYTLNGLLQALRFNPYQGTMVTEQGPLQAAAIVGAVGNGCQAGGGQLLCPNARINDGLLEVVALLAFPASALDQVVREIRQPAADNQYVRWLQVPWAEYHSDTPVPINLDGEPIETEKVRFEVCPGALDLVLPPDCPLLDP